MTWTIISFFFTDLLLKLNLFMSFCEKKIFVCLHSLLEIYLSFQCLCIAFLTLVFQMVFGGGNLTLLESLEIQIFANTSAASITV